MSEVLLRQVEKKYDKDVLAVKGINLEIKDKEFIVFVGPSGCGKSTTLRMIAGLEEITGGGLYFGDKLVNHIPPKDRDIAMVFQNYALYPHMTIYDNIAFSLKMKKREKQKLMIWFAAQLKSSNLKSISTGNRLIYLADKGSGSL